MIQKPRGTMDILPSDTPLWQSLEKTCLAVAARYGYGEIRLPTFESSELYKRGVGEGTDVVQKEMYDFFDKDMRPMTLRPEGTAGAVRAVIENSLYAGVMPLKLSYLVSCFRYELPQAGRSREFYQFGVECFGAASSLADAEVILLASEIFRELGISTRLEINSIGCSDCRPQYLKALREYFSANTDALCETCKGRLEKNPLRVLDCKSEICKKIAANAPSILDHLCEDCKIQFEELQVALQKAGAVYTVNPKIVRGLDYYRGAVFEFISDAIGAQSTICGGGRYDGLVESLGGPSLPGIGFAMGLSRMILCMKAAGLEKTMETPDIYIASIGEAAQKEAFLLAQKLRALGVRAQSDIVSRSLKAQMKYADKSGARFALVLGEDEIKLGKAVLKPLRGGEEREILCSNVELLAEQLKEG